MRMSWAGLGTACTVLKCIVLLYFRVSCDVCPLGGAEERYELFCRIYPGHLAMCALAGRGNSLCCSVRFGNGKGKQVIYCD